MHPQHPSGFVYATTTCPDSIASACHTTCSFYHQPLTVTLQSSTYAINAAVSPATHCTGSANHLTSKTSYAAGQPSYRLPVKHHAQTKIKSASSFRFVHSASDSSFRALASSGGETLELSAGLVCNDSFARRFGSVFR